jgi:hypothetical protein
MKKTHSTKRLQIPVTLSCLMKNFLHIPHDRGRSPVCVFQKYFKSPYRMIISYIYITRKSTIPTTSTLSEYTDASKSDLAIFKISYTHQTKSLLRTMSTKIFIWLRYIKEFSCMSHENVQCALEVHRWFCQLPRFSKTFLHTSHKISLPIRNA